MSEQDAPAITKPVIQADMDTGSEPQTFKIYTSLKEGLALKPDYIIENFLELGEQALLYGQPKAGKTFLAIQLACAVATGSPFLDMTVPKPRKVLYLNFEMGHRVFAERVAKQLKQPKVAFTDDDAGRKAEAQHYDDQLNENFVFSILPRSVDIGSTIGYNQLSETVKKFTPELVIFDTLSKVHNIDESKNNPIQGVLTHIRNVCQDNGRPVSQLIVHHARKAAINMEEKSGYMTPHEIRGGSAIRGEVDLIIGLAKLAGGAGGGAKHSLLIEARNVALDDVDLEFGPNQIFFIAEEQTSKKIEKAFEEELSNIDTPFPVWKTSFIKKVAEKFDQQPNTVARRLGKWLSLNNHRFISCKGAEGEGNKRFICRVQTNET